MQRSCISDKALWDHLSFMAVSRSAALVVTCLLLASVGPYVHALKPQDLCNWSDGKLPTSVRPLGYDIVLDVEANSTDPFIATGINGSVAIQLNSTSATSCIVIHGLNPPMEYSGISITQDGKTQQVKNVSIDEENRYAILQFPSAIQPAKQAVLKIGFSYPVDVVDLGISRGTFKDANGTSRDMLFTQLEPSGARMVFPSFDEPDMKALFNVTLVIPSGGELVALSNMPEIRNYTREADGKEVHVFDTTPLSPTYTIAVVVGKLKNLTKQCDLGGGKVIPVSNWAVPDSADKLELSLDAACNNLQYFSRLFHHPFDLPKMDQVAVKKYPEDIGAMENWGLITYQAPLLELDPETVSVTDLDAMYRVVAHEVAHQWFGNLVTTDAWNYVWVQEAFASYLQTLGANVADPYSNYFENFPQDNNFLAMILDGADSGTNVAMTIPGPPATALADQRKSFGVETYNKGGAVLRMLRAYMNRDTLKPGSYIMRRSALHQPHATTRQGLARSLLLDHAAEPAASASARRLRPGRKSSQRAAPTAESPADPFIASLVQYIEKYQFSNVDPRDLWGVMSNMTGLPVAKWMNNWTNLKFHPLVSVERDPSDPGQLIISQRNIVEATNTSTQSLPCNASAAAEDLWWVPVAYISQANPTSYRWAVLNRECEIRVTAPPGWVLLNAGRYGFYRTNYSSELWNELAIPAGQGKLDPSDLAGLLIDSAPAFDEVANVTIAAPSAHMEMTKGLAHTVNYQPWFAARASFETLKGLIEFEASANDSIKACPAAMENYMLYLTSTASAAAAVPGFMTSFTRLPALARLNSSEVVNLRRLRPKLVDMRLDAGDADLAQAAAAMVMSHRNASGGVVAALEKAVDPDLFTAVLKGAVLSGDMEAWQTVKEMYEENPEKPGFMVPLYSSRSPAVITQALDYLLDPTAPEDVFMILPSLAAYQSTISPEALNITWQWLLQHKDEIVNRTAAAKEAAKEADDSEPDSELEEGVEGAKLKGDAVLDDTSVVLRPLISIMLRAPSPQLLLGFDEFNQRYNVTELAKTLGVAVEDVGNKSEQLADVCSWLSTWDKDVKMRTRV